MRSLDVKQKEQHRSSLCTALFPLKSPHTVRRQAECNLLGVDLRASVRSLKCQEPPVGCSWLTRRRDTYVYAHVYAQEHGVPGLAKLHGKNETDMSHGQNSLVNFDGTVCRLHKVLVPSTGCQAMCKACKIF